MGIDAPGAAVRRTFPAGSRPKWDEMADLVDDRMLEAFAVDCSEMELPEKLWIRYNGIVQRINLYKPF